METPVTRPPIMTGAPPTPEHQVTLANWREAPQSAWAFRHVRELIPSAEIAATGAAALPEGARADLGRIAVEEAYGRETPLGAILAETATQGLVALRGGRVVGEWYGPDYHARAPHILFSVSKSLTALLAGVLVDRGLIDPDAPVTRYVPEAEDSAYAGATLRHVLDMTVSTSFEESYLDTTGDYIRYRIATGWNPVPEGAVPTDLRSFLLTLVPAQTAHGEVFHYVSPNTDMLGWVIERASGRRFAELFAERIWQPMGAERPAYITLDRLGAPRTAGGICTTLHDLARLGEMVRLGGVAGGRAVVPRWWIDDIEREGDRDAWRRGDMKVLFPEGRYRSKWYQSGEDSGALAAIGIHGQWIWIDPEAEVVIARFAAQPDPSSDALDRRLIGAYRALAERLSRPVL